jgi:hypothetical protein
LPFFWDSLNMILFFGVIYPILWIFIFLSYWTKRINAFIMNFFYKVYYKYPLYYLEKEYMIIRNRDLDFFKTTLKAYWENFVSNSKATETLKNSEKNIKNYFNKHFIIKKKYENPFKKMN